jgi:hypothetical protein
VGGPPTQPTQPAEQWPQTPEGWSAAWARYTALETPGSIVHLSQPTAGSGRAVTAVPAAYPVVLLAIGVAIGIAGLFPAYVSGASLARQSANLLPHVIYLAAWAASALLIWSGGARRRVGTLLGLGTSIVTFGLFFADVGTVIASGTHVLGFGLVLGLAGWLACTAGPVLALRGPSAQADGPRRPRDRAARPIAILVCAAAAAVGTAATFAPSWDSYTLRTPAGLSQYVTAGNSFANPAPVIAGDLAVMAALIAVVIISALWRPVRLGAALLAGAVIPMAAQAISAFVQVGQPVSPAAFGISPVQASQAGLTISNGLTPVFWIYCAFVLALVITCGWMLLPPRSPRPAGQGAYPGNVPWSMPPPATGTQEGRDLVPGTPAG